MKIGLSLSLCIKQMITGRVKPQDVICIITQTRAVTQEDWDILLANYCQRSWREDPDTAKALVNTLRRAGRIIQPRIWDRNYCHSTATGIWTTVPAVDDGLQKGVSEPVPTTS